MIVKRIASIITVERAKKKKKSSFKFGRARLGIKVLSFHNFGNLGGELKTRYDNAFGEKRKGDLYHKRFTICAINQ